MKHSMRFFTFAAPVVLAFALSSCSDSSSPSTSSTTPSDQSSSAVAGETEEITIQYPVAQFTGTPVPAKLPNLQLNPEGWTPPEKLVLPKGATNIALNKKVTASDVAPIIGDPAQVTDGDKEGLDDSFLELGPGQQWVQIDLEKSSDIYKLFVWHFHKAAVAYKDVIIQVSDDPEFKENVTTIWNSDEDNSEGFGAGEDPTYIETNHGRIIDVKAGVKGRYVRLYSNGSTMNEGNHYVEVEVYGKAAE